MSGPLSQLSPAQRGDLKVLAARLTAAAGGPEKAALVTRVARPALSKYQSTEHPDHFMPLDVLVELTLDTHRRVGPIVCRHLAALSGHAVFALPSPASGAALRAFSDVAKETGDVLSTFADRTLPVARRCSSTCWIRSMSS